MDSIPTEILSTTQLAALSALDTRRPLLSWAEGELTPDRFFKPATDTDTARTAEQKLLFAVFRDAVESVFRYHNDHTIRGMRLFKEAHDWFWSADRRWIYSFENICASLELDAEYIRRGLKRLYNPMAVSSAPSPTAPRKRRGTNHHLTAVYNGVAGRDS